MDLVQALVEAGANLEAQNGEGETPLTLAVMGGHADLIRYLAKAGANLESASFHETTPLMSAVLLSNAEIVRVLIALGANVNARSSDNQTALIFASKNTVAGNASLEIIKMLVEAGADVSVMAINGKRADETAADYGLADINEFLISIFNRDATLFNAVAKFHRENKTANAETQIVNWQAVKDALATGANPRFASPTSGVTSLILIADGLPGADDATMQTIIAHSDLNAQDKDSSKTALHAAADNNNARMVAWLIKAGANPNILDKYKRTPLDVAIAGNRQNVIPLLQKGETDVAPIENPLARDEGGSTKLMLLAERKPFDATKAAALLKAGVDVNATDILDYTALLSACDASSPDAVCFLLKNGAKPNILGRRNNTALILAAQLDSGTDAFDIVQQLIAAGADVNAKNKNGDTALSVAVEKLNGLAASALVKAGAKAEGNP